MAVVLTFAVFDSQDTGGGLTGQFLLSWAPTVVSILSTVSVVAVTWMNGKAGRKLRLKVGDVELEANSQAKIDHLVAQALALKALLAEQDGGLMNQIVLTSPVPYTLPVMISHAGVRFLEFFTANIRSLNTWRTYMCAR